MTEKRFETNMRLVIDTEKKYGARVLNAEEVVDLLNELHEENIELHIQNDFLKDENQHMRDLVNENEQLKQELNAFKPVVFQDMRKGTVILYRKGDV